MILLFFLFVIHTNQLTLREVSYSLIEKKQCNLIALKTCLSKLHDLEKDPLIMYYLGYFHLFGFPKDYGDDYFEFCTNYGEYDMIDDMTYHSRNLTLAKQYFKQSLANPNSELMISFIQLLEIQNKDNADDIDITLQYLSSIYMINSESALVAAFTQQFNCLRYNTAITLRNGTIIDKLSIIKQLVDEDEFIYYQLLNRLYIQCQDCNSIYYYGYQETLKQVQQYIDEAEIYEIDYESHIINEQKAENENEDAQLIKAYQLYTGNEDLGIVQNQELAMSIYRNMTDSIQATFNLAVIQYKQQNYQESVRLLKILVKQNVPAAYEQLGFMYLNGFGVPQNSTIAKEYYAHALKSGTKHAALPLAILKLNEGQYEEGIKDLLNLQQDYLEAKFPLIDIYRVSKESNITCDYAINLMHELLIELQPKNYEKFIKEADDSYYLEQFAVFMGASEPLRIEEQFLYNIKGAATQLADRLLEQSNLQEILYEIDSSVSPQALLSLSQLKYYRNELDLAFQYVDELIIKSENGTFEQINLIPAYLWKFRMNLLSFI